MSDFTMVREKGNGDFLYSPEFWFSLPSRGSATSYGGMAFQIGALEPD